MLGVKVRIQTRVIQNDDGTKKKRTEIVAEKVTFLAQAPNKTSNKKDDNKKKDAKKGKK